MTATLLPLPFSAPDMRKKLGLIVASYRQLTGRDLVPATVDPAQALWSAPRAVIAHGTEADPIFFFGNAVALDRFGMTLEQFTSMPSRLSAEPVLRRERQTLLDRVARNGYIDDYSGIRVSATGQRFRIAQAVVWNLIDGHGVVHGQAATFDHWVDLAG